MSLAFGATAQDFDKQIVVNEDYFTKEVIMPASSMVVDPIFIGGIDSVETAAGRALAKEWHDFIGLTPDPENEGEFWVSVNHEMVVKDEKIGDGGGMTVFKVKQNEDGTLTVLGQTLTDGRSGEFFNVDFKNTVGETGMNCGGINAPDGRIWTAEEWWRSSNGSIAGGVSDTTDFTITGSGIAGTFDGETIKKFENFNYMVEIDPMEAKAIRKQYNWGRQPFEGGAVAADNKTVYLGADATPGFFTKFVAENEGDFTSGKLYAFKQEAAEKWVEIANGSIEDALSFSENAMAAGATMFCRLEWVTIDPNTGNVYFTETGTDNLGNAWPETGNVAQHHVDRASGKGIDPRSSDYKDYYGRVLKYDVSAMEVTSYLEGGPEYMSEDGQHYSIYPDKHLSNPDGISYIMTGGKTFLMIQEDLNGTSYNRMPYGFSNRACEIFFLDLSIENPTVDDLQRISVVANGAEVTGAVAFPNGKTILLNSQHPELSEDINNYPFNHSLTVAISGFDGVITSLPDMTEEEGTGLRIHPNPTTREIILNKVTDVAIYDVMGKRVKVARNTKVVNVSGLTPGKYIVQTIEGETTSLIIQ